MKNRHWLEFTEYASFAGVAAGAVFSVLLEKALLLSTPLSVALLVGFANRRRVEQMQELQTEASVATLKQKLSKQITTLDQHIKTLPTPEMVGDVRNSMLRHSRDELKQLTTKIDTINETIDQYATLLDDQNLGGVKDEVQQLQGFYREMYGSLKRMQQTVDRVSAQNDSQDVTAQVNQLRAEAERLQTGLQTLMEQTQPTLSYLQEQVNHLNRQNTTLVQQVDANSLKRELDMLMDAVADLAPKRDLNTVMADIRVLQESQENYGQSEEALRKQLQTVMQRLQAVPDVPQFRAQIEETLSWQLRDINQQLRTLQNTKQFHSKVKEVLTGELDTINRQLQARSERPLYKLIFDVNANSLAGTNGSADSTQPIMLASRQLLEEALATAKHRLILIWPWSNTLQMDKALMKKLEDFVKSGRRLEVGWCHITASNDQRFLSPINRRWNLDSLAQRSLQLTLKYLLALKRRYPKRVRFQVMGTVENFLVADRTFAALGIENRLTTITPLEDVSLKLWTADKAVIQQLLQTFEHTELNPEDVESHWNRAITRYELGDRAGSMADIEQILATKPDSAIAYNMRGIIQFEQQDSAAALADFETALTLDGSQVSVYCNRGFVLSEQGDQYGAIADFSLAIQSSANANKPKTLGIAYFYRGLACQKLDDFEGAISDYTNALEFIPESPVIRYHRGLTYQAIDNHTAAVEDLEPAVALFQQHKSKTNAQRAARHLQQSRSTLTTREQNATTGSITSTVADETPVTIANHQLEAINGHGEGTATADVASDNVAAIANHTPSTERLQSTKDEPNAESEAFQLDHSVAAPSFLFPGEDRSHPTSIQNLDESIDSLEAWPERFGDELAETQSPLQTVEASEAGRVEPERVEAQNVEPERVEPGSVEAQNVEPGSVEAQNVEPGSVEAQNVEPGSVEAQNVEAESVEAESVEAESVEAESVEAESVEAESIGTQSVKAERLEAERVETQSAEPQNVETESVDTQNVEADRIETQNVEAERVDTQSTALESQQLEGEPGQISAENISPSEPVHATGDSTLIADPDDQILDLFANLEDEQNTAASLNGEAVTDAIANFGTMDDVAVVNLEAKQGATVEFIAEASPSAEKPENDTLAADAAPRPGPRRRRKTDLDRLVTTTLTDFFDGVDLADLDADRLSEFADDVQTSGPGTPSQALPSARATQLPLNSTDESPAKDTHQDGDQGLALFEEGLCGNATDESDLENDMEQGDRPIAGGHDQSSIPHQPAVAQSTVAQSTSALEYSDLLTDSAAIENSKSPTAPLPSDQPTVPSPSEDEPEEIEKLVTSTLTNFFADLSDNEIREAMAAYSAQIEKDAAERAALPQTSDDAPSKSSLDEVLSTDSGPSPSPAVAVPDMLDAEPDTSENGMSDAELQHFIADTSTNTTHSTPSEAASEPSETLGNLMETLEDSLGVDAPMDDDAYPDPWDTERAEPPPPIKPPIQSINEDLLAEPQQTNHSPANDNDLEEVPRTNALSGPTLVQSSTLEPSNPSDQPVSDQPVIDKLPTPDGMELGTATLTDFMAAMEGEDLGTQTLRDFFAVLNDEGSEPADAVAVDAQSSEASTRKEGEGGEGETGDRSDSDIQGLEGDMAFQPSENNDGASADRLANLHSDSDTTPENGVESVGENLESLLDLSDRF